MIRVYVLLGIAAFVIFCLVMFMGAIYTTLSRKKKMAEALEAKRQNADRDWKESESAQEMVGLYLNMVAKHGPDSDEAQAFRFGTSSPIVKRLHGDDAALDAFSQQANIIDETYRKIKKQRQ